VEGKAIAMPMPSLLRLVFLECPKRIGCPWGFGQIVVNIDRYIYHELALEALNCFSGSFIRQPERGLAVRTNQDKHWSQK
jgi:hypothetical protein